jgi:hypothetical protein
VKITSEIMEERAREIVEFLDIAARVEIDEYAEETEYDGGVYIGGDWVVYANPETQNFQAHQVQYWQEAHGEQMSEPAAQPFYESRVFDWAVFEIAKRIWMDTVEAGAEHWQEDMASDGTPLLSYRKKR